GLNAAQLCEPADSHNGDDGVFPCVQELDRLRPEVVEIVEPVLHVSGHRSLAVHRATVIERARDRPVVDVVRPEVGPGIQVTTVEGGSRVGGGGFVVFCCGGLCVVAAVSRCC